MCGIIGVFKRENAIDLVQKGLLVIKNRGKDGSSIHIENKSALGHCLHAIVSRVPQPFVHDSHRFAINGEIYNWKELSEKHNLEAQNDSELVFKLIQKIGLTSTLQELDGVYAFLHWENDTITIVRDLIGIKPLWYSTEDGFACASEKKALVKIGYTRIEELNPRQIVTYNVEKDSITTEQRKFFSITPELTESEEEIKKKLAGLLTNAIAKRIPSQKFGILFSGGIDSTVVAQICKQLGVDFTCYMAVFDDPALNDPKDLAHAEKVAKELNLDLKIKKLSLEEVEKLVPIVIPLIEDSTVTKVGVALTFYAACQEAQKDGIKVIFSGLGSEELFAGYERHKRSQNANNECLSGLLKMYERDTYRDDVVTMNNNLELRLPFLDIELTKYALRIPEQYKITEETSKAILRETSKDLGIPTEFAMRKKYAAQYGSNIDKALGKLAKKHNHTLLNTKLNPSLRRVLISFS